MTKVKAEFIPFQQNIPQTSTFKIFDFDDDILSNNKPENVIKRQLWSYANKNNLALKNYEIIK